MKSRKGWKFATIKIYDGEKQNVKKADSKEAGRFYEAMERKNKRTAVNSALKQKAITVGYRWKQIIPELVGEETHEKHHITYLLTPHMKQTPYNGCTFFFFYDSSTSDLIKVGTALFLALSRVSDFPMQHTTHDKIKTVCSPFSLVCRRRMLLLVLSLLAPMGSRGWDS